MFWTCVYNYLNVCLNQIYSSLPNSSSKFLLGSCPLLFSDCLFNFPRWGENGRLVSSLLRKKVPNPSQARPLSPFSSVPSLGQDACAAQKASSLSLSVSSIFSLRGSTQAPFPRWSLPPALCPARVISSCVLSAHTAQAWLTAPRGMNCISVPYSASSPALCPWPATPSCFENQTKGHLLQETFPHRKLIYQLLIVLCTQFIHSTQIY